MIGVRASKTGEKCEKQWKIKKNREKREECGKSVK